MIIMKSSRASAGGGSAAGNCSFVTARILPLIAQRVKTLSAEKPLKGLALRRENRNNSAIFVRLSVALHPVAPDFPRYHAPLPDIPDIIIH